MLSSLAKCKVREKTTLRQFVKNKVRETLSDLGYLDSTDYTQNMIPKSKTAHRRMNVDFILFFFYAQKIQLKQG